MGKKNKGRGSSRVIHPSGVECEQIARMFPPDLAAAIRHVWVAVRKTAAESVPDYQKAIAALRKQDEVINTAGIFYIMGGDLPAIMRVFMSEPKDTVLYFLMAMLSMMVRGKVQPDDCAVMADRIQDLLDSWGVPPRLPVPKYTACVAPQAT
jgi:hypothetical protein